MEIPLLSDSNKLKNVKTGRRRSVDAETNKFWSDSQKIEAVTTYFMLGGSMTAVSRALKIPRATLNVWKRTDWWSKLEDDIRKEERMQLSTQLRKVVNNSWDIVSDRLQNGDWILNQKTGELLRKPVGVRDAGRIAVDAAKLRNDMDLHNNFTVATEQIEDKLAKLAKAFTNLAKGITTEDAEDVAYVEQVENNDADQREMGENVAGTEAGLSR